MQVKIKMKMKMKLSGKIEGMNLRYGRLPEPS